MKCESTCQKKPQQTKTPKSVRFRKYNKELLCFRHTFFVPVDNEGSFSGKNPVHCVKPSIWVLASSLRLASKFFWTITYLTTEVNTWMTAFFFFFIEEIHIRILEKLKIIPKNYMQKLHELLHSCEQHACNSWSKTKPRPLQELGKNHSERASLKLHSWNTTVIFTSQPLSVLCYIAHQSVSPSFEAGSSLFYLKICQNHLLQKKEKK